MTDDADRQHANEPTASTEPEDSAAPDTGDAASEATADSDADSADYWKRMKRQADQRNKRLARELESLRREHMTEQERAVTEARDSGRAEALRELSGRVVDAEIRSAAAHRPLNVDALLTHLDRTRFVDETGEPDREAITAWLDELAPVQPETRPATDLGQGARGAVRSSPADVFGQLITRSLK